MGTVRGLLRSRTFWFNVASCALELGGYATQILPPGSALIAVNVANIILRTVTTKALADK